MRSKNLWKLAVWGTGVAALSLGGPHSVLAAEEEAAAAPSAAAPPVGREVLLEAALPEGFPAPGPAEVVQIKHYPAYRVARADGLNAFGQLFRHISKHDIAMTAPVEMTLEDAGDGGGARPVDMMFMYARPDMGQPGPDDTVDVMDLPAVSVFSLGRFGAGRLDEQAQALDELHAAIAADPAWQTVGKPRRFGYNSPFVPREQRYWEVQVPVGPVEADDAAGDDAAAAG